MFRNLWPRGCQVKVEESGKVHCLLVSDFHNRAGQLVLKDKPHLSAIAEQELDNRRGGAAGEVRSITAEYRFPPAGAWDSATYPDDEPMYHGPCFAACVAFARHAKAGGEESMFCRSGIWWARAVPMVGSYPPAS